MTANSLCVRGPHIFGLGLDCWWCAFARQSAAARMNAAAANGPQVPAEAPPRPPTEGWRS